MTFNPQKKQNFNYSWVEEPDLKPYGFVLGQKDIPIGVPFYDKQKLADTVFWLNTINIDSVNDELDQIMKWEKGIN